MFIQILCYLRLIYDSRLYPLVNTTHVYSSHKVMSFAWIHSWVVELCSRRSRFRLCAFLRTVSEVDKSGLSHPESRQPQWLWVDHHHDLQWQYWKPILDPLLDLLLPHSWLKNLVNLHCSWSPELFQTPQKRGPHPVQLQWRDSRVKEGFPRILLWLSHRLPSIHTTKNSRVSTSREMPANS